MEIRRQDLNLMRSQLLQILILIPQFHLKIKIQQHQKIKLELEESLSGLSIVKEIRGLGLALAIELTSPDISELVLYECLSNGLSFKVSNGNILTLTPPLTITDQEMDDAVCIIRSALQKAHSMESV